MKSEKMTKDGQTKGQKDRQSDAQTNYRMSEKSKVINFNLKTMKEFFFVYCWILNATKALFVCLTLKVPFDRKVCHRLLHVFCD
jgi:hypothetical protein